MTTQQHILKVDGEIVAREKLEKWITRLLDRLPDGDLILEIRQCDITEQQRKYYYSQVSKMAVYFGMEMQSLHKRLKMLFFPEDMIEIGKTSIKDLDEQKMSQYIDDCIRFSAEQGYVWGDAEEYKQTNS